MANHFQELYRLPPNLFIEGSPIIIEAGALQKDTITNNVLAQLKFRVLSNQNIVACKVSIKAYEPNGSEVEGVSNYAYLDINVGIGKDFGFKTPVYLPNNTSCKFTAAVTEVVFANGEVWNHEPVEWKQVPIQESIAKKLPDYELQKQYELEIGQNCKFIPVIQHGLFQCTCGTTNLSGATRCYNCQRKYEALIAALDINTLASKKDTRIQQETEEHEAAKKAAENARLKTEKNQKKIKRGLQIVIPVMILMIAGFTLTPIIKPIIEKEIAYRNAKQLLADGFYDEAQTAFEKLDEYRNAADMVLEAQYQKAASLASEEQYESAIAIWESLGEYSDSASRIELAESDWKENDYQEALALAANKDYVKALTILKILGDYKDSCDLCISFSYDYARLLTENAEYEEAIVFFTYTQGYQDADVLKLDATYQYACQLLENQEYSNAIKQFNACLGYKDTDSKLLDAKYGYVTTHTNRTDMQTYRYLNSLIAENYPGAQDIYDRIYTLVLTVAINDNLDSLTNMSSVSKYDPLIIHYKLSGGTPEASSIILSYKYTFPNGATDTETVPYTVSIGYWDALGWLDGVWEDPSKASTGTFRIEFYDPDGNVIGSGSIKITN